MSCSRFVFACLVTLSLAAGCDNNTNIGPLVPFSRPEHVAFACFAQRAGTSGDNAQWDVRPQGCCARYSPEYGRNSCGVAVRDDLVTFDPTMSTHLPAHLHALVTQSTRGEVAAVDTTLGASDRVLDSDSLIPGYTFLDSGGLPSAVVMPARQPRAVVAENGAETGSKYAFVASAEEYQVRAIAACRFRSGTACGPVSADPTMAPRLIVPLPGAPGDMILGPDDALWVTLPDLQMIARIELADPAANDAFALDGDKPRVPRFFRVPQVNAGEPAEPVAEATTYGEPQKSYVEVCGLGKAYQPAVVALPRAPHAPMADIRPKLLRYDAVNRLLLVADAAAPILHAFSIDIAGDDRFESTLTWRGALPTGAPIRDLALTAEVPVEVARLGNAPGNAPDPAQLSALADGSTVRYVYAIDDRDGSVMVFKYGVSGGVPQLTPLLAPASNLRFSDRIGITEPANALDVVDTRTLSIDAAAGKTRVDLELLENVACGGTFAASPSSLETIKTNAANNYLRGVFVSVVAENGTIAMLDVHDLDLACRVERDCDYAGRNPTTPLRPGLRTAVAVRRHSWRRSAASALVAGTTNDPLFQNVSNDDCKPTQPITNSGEGKLCAPTDPWLMTADSYAVQYRAPIPGTTSPSGSLTTEGASGPDQVVLQAPRELDLCGRGVLPGDRVVLTYPVSNVARRAQGDTCTEVGGEDENALLTVREAYRDRLVLDRPANADVARLTQCFPTFVNFDVRAQDFLVVGSSYLTNVVTNPSDGACVVDSVKFPLQTSRAKPNELFANPYFSFKLAENAALASTKSATVTLTQGSTALSIPLSSGSSFNDVQPATVRYYPGTNRLFVVDSASTGLSRFDLAPLQRDD